MSNKIERIHSLFNDTCTDVVKSADNWMSFLQTSSNNYKYSFVNQLLIYAQRPTARACATFEVWNQKLSRSIIRGSKGIVLLDDSDGSGKLYHVFDVADTRSYNDKPLPLWTVNDEIASSLGFVLQEHYDLKTTSGDLDAVLIELANNKVNELMPDALNELASLQEEAFSQDLDAESIEAMLRKIMASSLSYVLLSRCGSNPLNYLDSSDFDGINNFTTYDALSVLGTTLKNSSQELLNSISLSVKSITKMIEHTHIQKEENNNVVDLQTSRGLSASEPVLTEDRGELREVRNVEKDLSEGEQGESVHRDAVERDITSTSGGDRRDSTESVGSTDSAASRGSERDGADEARESDVMGGNDEQYSPLGRGNHSDGIDLQLSDSKSEASDLTHIPEAQEPVVSSESEVPVIEVSEPEPSEISSELSFEEMVIGILKLHQHLKVDGAMINNYFIDNPVIDSNVTDKHIEFLKKAYNVDYTEFDVSGVRVGYHASDDGLEIWQGNYLTADGKALLSWSLVSELVNSLVQREEYVALGDEALPSEKEQETIIENAVTSTDSIYKPQQGINVLHDVQIGDNVHIGTNEFEVVGIENDSVIVTDVNFPLFTESFTISDFLEKVNENPINNFRYRIGNVAEQKQVDSAEIVLTDESNNTVLIGHELIDTILRSGSNKTDSVYTICAYYKREKSDEENIRFLAEEYGVNTGKGFVVGDKQYSVIFDEDGIRVAEGSSVNRAEQSVLLPWSDVNDRIKDLISSGKYISADDYALVEDKLLDKAATVLWDVHRDVITSEVLNNLSLNAFQSLPLTLNRHNFTEDVPKLKEVLAGPERAKQLAVETEILIEACKGKNPIVSIGRYEYNNLKKVLSYLDDLSRDTVEFPLDSEFASSHEAFITDDEIDFDLMGGSHFADGKYRIYLYFNENHTAQEKAEFLKNEYGIGGGNYALGGVSDGNHNHDSKGIVLTRGVLSNPYDAVTLSWSAVAKKIDQLISENRYLSEEEIDHLPHYEKEVLATRIYHFFRDVPEEIERPYSSGSFDNEAINEIVELLYEADDGNVEVLAETLENMQFYMRNIANEDDRRYEYNSACLKDFEQYISEISAVDSVNRDKDFDGNGVEPVGAPVYRYYSQLRHLEDGYPMPEGNEPVNVVSFDKSTYIDDFGITAWGYVEYASELSFEEVSKYDLMLYSPPIVGADGKGYQLGFGMLGNGTTVWNRLEKEYGDYKTVAHISDSGDITVYDNSMPQEALDKIQAVADRDKANYEEKLRLAAESLAEVEKRYAPPKPGINRRTTACKNYKALNQFAGDVLSGKYSYMRFESEGYEPLSVELIGNNLISMMHTYVQNGDLMRDPDMVFEFDNEKEELQCHSYEMSYGGFYQQVYASEGRANLGLQRELNSFLNTWLKNISQQGFELVRAVDARTGEEIDFTVQKEVVDAEKDNVSRETLSADNVQGSSQHRRQLMLDEYNRLKEECGTDCLFYRVGAFYEIMGEDAIKHAELLGLEVAHVSASDNEEQSVKIPVLGVPEAIVDRNIELLNNAGFSCAVAEQGEDNKQFVSRIVGNDLTDDAVPSESPVNADVQQGQIKAVPIAPDRVYAGNYRITDDLLGVGGAKEKFHRNVAAIELLRKLETEDRKATAEEQEVLAQYVGWGGLSMAFDSDNKAWSEEYKQLAELLTPEEYRDARESTLNAFYTPPIVIKAIYDAIGQMGFERGNILEPSCGIGNFMGLLPSEMSRSKMYGVELDSVSGRIAQKLYPDANIEVKGFEESLFPDNFFDVAIGNVPFGQYQINDKAFNKYHFMVHDYFFAKSLEKVRPGGIVAFVTSKGTMDKKSPEVRKYIAQHAELLGAIRLPNNTFTANAGTEAVSDILFLKKRDRAIDIEPDWVYLSELTDPETGEVLCDKDYKSFAVNSYFAEHPEMVLGKAKVVSGPFGEEVTYEPYADAKLEDLLQEAIKGINGSIDEFEIDRTDSVNSGDIPADPNVRNFSFTELDGKLYFRENSVMHPVEMNNTAMQRIKGLIEVRDVVRSLIDAQLSDYSDNEIKALQDELNRVYDEYTDRYGLINSRGNRLAFSDDSSYYLLCSLEHIDQEGNLIRKADMFTKRTIRPVREQLSADSSIDALAISIGEKARVDLEYMRELTGFSYEKLIEDLKGSIFPNPERFDKNGVVVYEPADEYLSGNVKEKLRVARQFAEMNPEKYGLNVQALEEVQPEPLSASEISVRLGATWIPTDVYQQFMQELLNTPSYWHNTIKVVYTPYTGHWDISNKNYDAYNLKAREEYGTSRANAYRILEDSLNLKDVTIYDTVEDADGKKRQVVNKEQTTIAQQKQQVIKDAFADWIWQDVDRRQRLVDIYNDKFNSNRLREFNGDYIPFHGMNPEITLMKHQRDAIARILYGGNSLLAHSVGAGKTYEMVAAAMESKRLGLAHKNMFVVPNHLTGQWASEILRLYPSANVLVATKKDFETKNRKKFCARIATGDYDAVIIGHSQYEKIPLSTERQKAILEAQLNEIMEGIVLAKEADNSRVTVKQLERSKKSVEARLDKLNDEDRKDDVVTFEELGVDRQFIDEAHYFKNLFLYTKMSNVAGISQTEAKKSSDLFMKTQYMDEKTGNKGNVFATGTPVSNSMSEIYTMQRYLQHDTLVEMGLQHFDSWASTFGETVTAVELSPEGTGYRAKTRFARFYNLPELMTVFKEIADIKTADELDLDVPDVDYHVVSVEPSDEQREIVASFSERAKKVRDGGVEPEDDNMLKITNDGRNLGLDQRCYDPDLPDYPGSKVNACVENIYDIWDKYKEKRLAQLVFSDLSTPHYDGSFSVYDDIKSKLIAKGVPENEIAFIHDAKTEVQKEALFEDVRAGKVRVLLGSTQKMGAGTNVQDKLIALHDLDCPWRPADLEQRSGRIIRQGNKQEKVEIFRYVTKDTFDAYMWQLVENKQKFISQVMTSKTPERAAEEVDTTALSYAEIKALATGNPYIKEKMDLDIRVAKLKVLKANFLNRKYAMEDSLVKDIPNKIKSTQAKIEGYKKDIELIGQTKGAEDNVISPMVVGGVPYVEKDAANAAVREALKGCKSPNFTEIGEYRGFKLLAIYDPLWKHKDVYLKGNLTYNLGRFSTGAPGIGNIDSVMDVDKLSNGLANAEKELDNLYVQKANAEELIKKPFTQEEELQKANARLNELNILLNNDRSDSEAVPEEAIATAEVSEPSDMAVSDRTIKKMGSEEVQRANEGFAERNQRANEFMDRFNGEFSSYEEAVIRTGFHNGLTEKQILTFADKRFSGEQMYAIMDEYTNGVSIEQMAVVLDPNLTVQQIHGMCSRMLQGEEVKKPLSFAIDSARAKVVDSGVDVKDNGDRWP